MSSSVLPWPWSKSPRTFWWFGRSLAAQTVRAILFRPEAKRSAGQHRSQGPAAKDVDVQVGNLLARVEPDIGKQAVAFRHQPGIARDLAHRSREAGDFRVGRALRKIVPRHVRGLRNHQDVGRRERVDVAEGQGEFVLIDPVRWALAADDASGDIA